MGVFGEFGIDVGFDDLLICRDFALLAGEVDGFPKIAQDEGAPWVLRLLCGFDGLGLGFGLAGLAGWCGQDAGGEAGFQHDGVADGGGEAEEDEARVGAPGAGRFGGLLLLRLLDGKAGELHAEFGEFLEHVQVSCAQFGDAQLGGLGAGRGEDGVQGFWVPWGSC